MFQFSSMENTIISLKEGLALMSKKDDLGRLVPFDMTYRTFNSTSKQGGKLKSYLKAKLLIEANPNAVFKDNLQNILNSKIERKEANHFKNRTRNIELSTGEVAKIRIDFIITINNKKIIY